MAFSLEDFKASFDDLARAYWFRVQFSGVGVSVTFPEDISMLIKSTTLPQKVVAAIDAEFMGQQLKLAGNVTYPDWTCTFRVDSNLEIYNTMRKWMNLIRPNTGENPANMNAPLIYKGTIDLYQIDGNQKDVGHISLRGAFPITLGDIAYDTATSDVQEFPVTFSYDYNIWTPKKAA